MRKDPKRKPGGFSKFTKPGYEIIRSHPTLPVLACVSSNQQVLLFDETSGNLIRTFSYGRKDKDQPASCKRSKKVTQMGWNINGSKLATGFSDGNIIVWKYPSGKILLKKKSHWKSVTEILWNPEEESILATLDRNRTLVLIRNFEFQNDKHCTIRIRNHNISMEDREEDLLDSDERENTIEKIKWISKDTISIGCNQKACEIDKIGDHIMNQECVTLTIAEDETIQISSIQSSLHADRSVHCSNDGMVYVYIITFVVMFFMFLASLVLLGCFVLIVLWVFGVFKTPNFCNLFYQMFLILIFGDSNDRMCVFHFVAEFAKLFPDYLFDFDC